MRENPNQLRKADGTLKIVNKNISDIKPYENNPRINVDSVDKVANSIKEFGYRVPIIIDKNNVIVAGHTRLLAAEKLGITEIPCIVADDLTEQQINAFRLVDNKTTEFSDWDYEKLKEELYALDMDLSEYGFEKISEEFKEVLDNTSKELSADEYNDDNFECTCPRCGFKFNR